MSPFHKTNPRCLLVSVLGANSSVWTRENSPGYQNACWEKLLLHVFFAFRWTLFFFCRIGFLPSMTLAVVHISVELVEDYSAKDIWHFWQQNCECKESVYYPYCLGSWWHNNTVTPLLMARTLWQQQDYAVHITLPNARITKLGVGGVGGVSAQSAQVSALQNLCELELENYFSQTW